MARGYIPMVGGQAPLINTSAQLLHITQHDSVLQCFEAICALDLVQQELTRWPAWLKTTCAGVKHHSVFSVVYFFGTAKPKTTFTR